MKTYRNLTLFMSIEKKRNSSIKQFYLKKEKKQFYKEVKKLKKYYLYVGVTPPIKLYRNVTIRGVVTVAGGSEKKKNLGGGPGQPSIFFIHSFKAPLPREFEIPSEHNQPIHFFQPSYIRDPYSAAPYKKKTTVPVRERFYRNKPLTEKPLPADQYNFLKPIDESTQSVFYYDLPSPGDFPYIHYNYNRRSAAAEKKKNAVTKNKSWHEKYHAMCLDVTSIHQKGFPGSSDNNMIIPFTSHNIDLIKFMAKMDDQSIAKRHYCSIEKCYTISFCRTNLEDSEDYFITFYNSSFTSYENNLQELLAEAIAEAPYAVQEVTFPDRMNDGSRYCLKEGAWHPIPDIPKKIKFDVDYTKYMEEKALIDVSSDLKKASRKKSKEFLPKLIQNLDTNSLIFPFAILTVAVSIVTLVPITLTLTL